MNKIIKKKTKINLCVSLLILGLLLFILQIFVFESPDGIIGFILFLFSIYLIIGSIIKLCKLSDKFKSSIFDILDLLFFI